MAMIHELIIAHLPPCKSSSHDWKKFNAVCCHHRGHKPDTRGRGNIKFEIDGKITYSCFNCGFAVIYDPASLTKKFETFMSWLNISLDEISVIRLAQLQQELDGIEHISIHSEIIFNKKFPVQSLPPGSKSFSSIAETEHVPKDFLDVAAYLYSRGDAVANNYEYYWSPLTKWGMNKRVIIPYYYHGDIVGYTARYASDIVPENVTRYYNSDLPPGYLFNGEVIDHPTRHYCLLFEGPIDAIVCDGTAAFGSKLTHEQLAWLLQCKKQIIVVPDRQRKNQGLIDVAIEFNWAVSFPDWEDYIKDAAQASINYGRLYTLKTIIDNATDSPLEIGIKRTRFAKGN